eukprot:4798795-Alexandrium_andersonii.AAC.1
MSASLVGSEMCIRDRPSPRFPWSRGVPPGAVCIHIHARTLGAHRFPFSAPRLRPPCARCGK